jgi:aryl-alcohol dehydrogenase-like predicted oxidoreductase
LGSLCGSLFSGGDRLELFEFSALMRLHDLRKNDPKFQAPRFAQYLAAVEALDHFARDNYRKGVIHLAVRWVLDRGDTNIALWGARRPDQLAAVREAMGWRIDSAAMTEIERILRDTITNPVGPEFMAPPDQLAA